MSVIFKNVKSKLSEKESEIVEKAAKKLGLKRENIASCGIYKTSLDARKRDDIHFVHSVLFELKNEKDEILLCEKNKDCTLISKMSLNPKISDKKHDGKIVVVGFGPAGMFCALTLAEFGYKPVVLERGEEIEKRVKTVESFFCGGNLNENSNVQFGEGGAGTFSDGKLTTRIKDPLCAYVLDKLCEMGAPEDIKIKAKPHIGTDNLRNVVKNIRERIISLGGEVRFGTKLCDFSIKNREINKVRTQNDELNTSALVLAIGHSARDTFELLVKNGIYLEPKPFSVGARIEHPQDRVDESLYGEYAKNPLLPVGEYQLSYRENDRAVYTFCMCPGGFVVPAASESETVVTNGMSEYARDGKNANSALVVSVSKEDFGNDALDGVRFIRALEKKAYALGKESYKAPGCTVGSFLDGKGDLDNAIEPTYSRGLEPCNFYDLFPPVVLEFMKKGILDFSKKMNCFGDKNAVLTAPETRTSSPVRITRNENLTSLSASNLYPSGEGAGYAGGIMSAAVDGIKVALKIMESYAP